MNYVKMLETFIPIIAALLVVWFTHWLEDKRKRKESARADLEDRLSRLYLPFVKLYVTRTLWAQGYSTLGAEQKQCFYDLLMDNYQLLPLNVQPEVFAWSVSTSKSEDVRAGIHADGRFSEDERFYFICGKVFNEYQKICTCIGLPVQTIPLLPLTPDETVNG